MTTIWLPPQTPERVEPRYDYDVELGGVLYRLELIWRDRTESWYVNLYDSDDEPLILGQRLVVDYPLMASHTGRVPSGGMLILVDTSGDSTEADYEALGRRCELLWLDVDDWEPAEAVTYKIEVGP